jgi:hypothetical protein
LIRLIELIKLIIDSSGKSGNPARQCDVVYETTDGTDAHGNVFGHSACWGIVCGIVRTFQKCSTFHLFILRKESIFAKIIEP